MVKFFIYVTGVALSALIGKLAVGIAADGGSNNTVQIVTFVFATMASLVATVLTVESDENQVGFLFRFYRKIGKRFSWFMNVAEILSQGMCIAFGWEVSDYLQVFVNGEKLAEWHVQGRVPREVLKLGITEADFEAAIKGATISQYVNGDYVELLPVGYSYKSRYKGPKS